MYEVIIEVITAAATEIKKGHILLSKNLLRRYTQ